MHKIEELIEEIRLGRPVVLVDDEDRENEGDLIIAADAITPEWINFMAKECRGLICLSMPTDQINRLNLPMMVSDSSNRSPHRTAFTVSIEAARGVTTGISAFDRAHTIKTAISKDAVPGDVVTPGHIFPLRAQEGGVLKRAGHSEGSIDLARLAGRGDFGVICEIMNDDGTMARIPDLEKFCERFNFKLGSISDLIKYRIQNETLVEEVSQANLPSRFGNEFKIRIFRSKLDGVEHAVLQLGDIDPGKPTLVRVHSECLTGDVFGSLRCDCGDQLQAALHRIRTEKSGVLLYLKQEGRGIGLGNKIRAYALQEKGMDTVDANVHLGFKPDERDYGIGAQILRAIGVRRLKLMTNNPSKRAGLGGYGLEIVERIALRTPSNSNNVEYLETKRNRMGHLLSQELDK
ncbi:MAG: bifunctional 3,4-dihydroxy-2-butanone-4-phosphate synthase/GTP cyclohydrolase II [Oligoflexia bacterium]|nr:bifunctional 3,4-dihydroxy-2-butanone-4-phosphate synthase/GTP cyclohydrolase II [Oligoflexia bacterium]